jgi:hypothetical protein
MKLLRPWALVQVRGLEAPSRQLSWTVPGEYLFAIWRMLGAGAGRQACVRFRCCPRYQLGLRVYHSIQGKRTDHRGSSSSGLGRQESLAECLQLCL